MKVIMMIKGSANVDQTSTCCSTDFGLISDHPKTFPENLLKVKVLKWSYFDQTYIGQPVSND